MCVCIYNIHTHAYIYIYTQVFFYLLFHFKCPSKIFVKRYAEKSNKNYKILKREFRNLI